MSGYVNKLFTTISSALEFNTATLSGAIDIVVIEDDAGHRQCSPFHVRFGKLQLLKSRGIPVQIDLNGNRTSLRMLLGAAGEAYFYNPQEAAAHHESGIPETSSPPHVSVADPMNLAVPSSNSGNVPIRSNSQPASSPNPQLSLTATCSDQHPFSSLKPQAHGALSSTGARPSDSTSTLPNRVVQTKETDYPFGYISDSEVELTRIEREGTAEVVDEPRSPPLFASQRKWSSTVALNPPAGHNADCRDESKDQMSFDSDHDAGLDPLDDQNSSLFGLPGSPASISAPSPAATKYTAENAKSESSPRSTPQDMLADLSSSETTLGPKHREEPDALTISNSIGDIVGEEETKLECRSVDGYDADDDNVDDLQDLQEQVSYVLSKPQNLSIRKRDTTGSEDEAAAGQEKGDESAIEKDEDATSREGVLDMSLCGGLIKPDMEEFQILELFERHRVSHSEFTTNPRLLYDPSLLFRIDNRLVELRVAVPFIFSALAFNEKMDIDLLDRTTASEEKVEVPKSPPTPSRRFRWFGWASPAVAGEPLLQEEDISDLEKAAQVAEEEAAKGLEAASTRPDDVRMDVEGDDTSGEDTGRSDVKEVAREPRKDGSLPDCNLPEDRESAALKTYDRKKLEVEGESAGSGRPQASVEPLADSEPVAISFAELDPDALSLRPTTEELNSLALQPGANTIRFFVESSSVELNCRIFLWSCHTKIAISDVDGTITRSDVLGHLLPAVGRDWSQVGVAGLYTQIEKNGYKLLYLTARPIGQASQTRAFLRSVAQGSAKLPNGPVLMSPNRLVESFTREVIRRKPHEFKIAALREVRSLFSPDYNPFHAGFGNRDTDIISYRAVGLIPQRIFVVNPKGELCVMKAKYESAASYSTLQDLVESVFPDISGHGGLEKIQALTESATYNDWNYWKGSLPKIDLDELLGGR